MSLKEKVKCFIHRHHLIKRGDKIIVAVSGGPDSMCLLSILNQLKYEIGFHLYAIHINHNLRESASKDALFFEKSVKKLHIPFDIFSVHVRKRKKISSIEELARKARLACLARCAKKYQATAIALGHNKNDLVETVIMRLLRGTGMMGLRGILPKRDIDGSCFIRPLLDISRSEIESFLKKEKIRSRLDPTNKKMKFLRNKVRQQLLPLLRKQYNRNIVETLSHFAQTISTDYQYLEEQVQKAFKNIGQKKNSQTITLNLKKLQNIHPALKRLLIRLAIENLVGNTRKLTFSHIRAVEDLLLKRPEGTIVHLPHRIGISKSPSLLVFQVRNS